MRRYPTHGFRRNTHYHRRRPRPADQRHHGWYVLAPRRPVGHGGCANGGQRREPPHHSHRHCRHRRSREDPRDEGLTAPSPPRDPTAASAPSGADQCSDSGRDGLWRSAIRSHCDDTHRTTTRLATEPLQLLRSVFQLAAGSGWASAVTTAV